MFALEKHFFLVCVFVLMLVSMIDRHYKNGLLKNKQTHITTKVATGDSSHVGPSDARDSSIVAIVKVSWF